MRKRPYKIKQNGDGKYCLFDNEKNDCLMISENLASLLNVCNLLNEQQFTIIGLQEMIKDNEKQSYEVIKKERQLVCDMLYDQEITIDHLAQERDYWKNKTKDLLYQSGKLKSPRERLMNYYYGLKDDCL